MEIWYFLKITDISLLSFRGKTVHCGKLKTKGGGGGSFLGSFFIEKNEIKETLNNNQNYSFLKDNFDEHPEAATGGVL